MTAGAGAARSPVVLIGAGLVTVFALMALLAPWLAPYDPQQPTGPSLAPPSIEHWLGTNLLGQDVLSQLIWGARPALLVATVGAAVTFVLAVVIGVGAALFGGLVDLLAMRAADVFIAMPTLPILILIGSLAGANRGFLAIIVGLLMWPPIARLVRSQALSVRQRGFVAAARGYGGGPGYLVRRHFVPALGPVLVAGLVAVAGNAIMLETTLAFLGLADPLVPSWGSMINEALAVEGILFLDAWMWWVLPTGFTIVLAVLGFTFLGVGLEPVLNPRWRRM